MTLYVRPPKLLMVNAIGFGLGGSVTLYDASTALSALNELIRGVTDEVAPGADINWIVDHLSSGSLAAELVGESDDLQAVDRVIEAYVSVGSALQRREPIPYPAAERPARKLLGLIDGRIESFYFQARDMYVEITEMPSFPDAGPSTVEGIGSVSGILNTLSRSHGIRVWVYDPGTQRSIRCHLTDEQSEAARDLWGMPVIVDGVVRRAAADGRPISVTRVRTIRPFPTVAPGSWREVVGLVPREEGEQRAEQSIRRARDAE